MSDMDSDREKDFAPGERHLRNVHRFLGKALDECEECPATDCEKECEVGEEDGESFDLGSQEEHIAFLHGKIEEKDRVTENLHRELGRLRQKVSERDWDLKKLREMLDNKNKQIDSFRLDQLFNIGKKLGEDKMILKLRGENEGLKAAYETLQNALAEIGEIVEETE